MRIRRRDREASRSPEFVPFDQDTAPPPGQQGPTSIDPVKSLISEVPPTPPQDDQGPSGTLDERTPTDEVPVVDTPPPPEAESPVVDTPPPASEAPAAETTSPPAPEAPAAETAPEPAVVADLGPVVAGPDAGTVPAARAGPGCVLRTPGSQGARHAHPVDQRRSHRAPERIEAGRP